MEYFEVAQTSKSAVLKTFEITNSLAPQTRGEGQGEGLLIKRSNDFNAPPLPGPLLHVVEEREKLFGISDDRELSRTSSSFMFESI